MHTFLAVSQMANWNNDPYNNNFNDPFNNYNNNNYNDPFNNNYNNPYNNNPFGNSTQYPGGARPAGSRLVYLILAAVLLLLPFVIIGFHTQWSWRWPDAPNANREKRP